MMSRELSQRRPSALHRVLGALHAIVALNAIGGGLYGLAGAEGVPLSWLDGTPFSSYRVPSVILLVVIGGLQSTASVLAWRQDARARTMSTVAGCVLLGWIAVQVAMIGFVSWLQPAVGLAAIIELALVRRVAPAGDAGERRR